MSANEPKQVAFRAELVALGQPDGLDVSELQYDGCGVLVFVAPYEDVSKAAPLFRAGSTTLYAGGSFDDNVKMHQAVVEELRRLRLELEAVKADRQRLAVESAAHHEYVPGLRAERDEAVRALRALRRVVDGDETDGVREVARAVIASDAVLAKYPEVP